MPDETRWEMVAPGSQVPAPRSRSSLIDALRGASASVPVKRVAVAAAAGRMPSPRMVFAIDATASREHAWEAARQVTDTMFSVAPSGIEVALAVHGGGEVKMFSTFQREIGGLRDLAAAVSCSPGPTRLLPILRQSLTHPGIRAVAYVGDAFEEDLSEGLAVANQMRLRGTRLFVLHEAACAPPGAAGAFAAMAARTGGQVLPFDVASVDALRDALSAVAAWVSGGSKLLEARALASPAARLLLGHG